MANCFRAGCDWIEMLKLILMAASSGESGNKRIKDLVLEALVDNTCLLNPMFHAEGLLQTLDVGYSAGLPQYSRQAGTINWSQEP